MGAYVVLLIITIPVAILIFSVGCMISIISYSKALRNYKMSDFEQA